MVAGLDVVAGAAQVISLAFQVFQGCIDAYKFWHTARLIGSEGNLLRTKLQIERYRLEEWAHCSRLNSSNPDRRLNWQLIHGILEQQHTTLTSAEKLRSKYGLDIQEENSMANGDEGLVHDGDDEQLKSTKKTGDLWSGLDRIFRALKPKLYADSTSSRTISAANGPLRRLQWAAAGREKVVKVIDDLGELNTQLERLLDLQNQAWLQSGMAALLRDALSHATDMAEVEALQALLRPSWGVGDAAIASAAEFKRIRLVLGVDQRADEVRPPQSQAIYSSMPRLKMLKEKRLKASGDQSAGNSGIEIRTYNSEPVLVEWRQTSASNFDKLEKQMQSLALLLGSVDNTFATLPCLGLTASKENSRFAMVYELRATMGMDVEDVSLTRHRTLHELMVSQQQISLSNRMHIARTLAAAVVQLHTAGWLHKSIRSDNVIFFGTNDDNAPDFLGGQPYMLGYDYARQESEMALTELPNAPLYTDLYRHPDKRGSLATGYRKRFDVFSLGCLLTELALWEHLVGVLSRLTGTDWSFAIAEAESRKQDLKLPSLLEVIENPAFTESVLHAAGAKYLEAIQICLTEGSADDGDESSLETQRSILNKLRECSV